MFPHEQALGESSKEQLAYASVFQLSVCPSHCFDDDISGTPWGNFSKFGINIH